MAAPVINITNSPGMTLLDDAETTTGWAGFNDGSGGTPSVVSTTEVFIQNATSNSAKVSGTNQDKGIWFDEGTGVDMTTSGRHFYGWVQNTTSGQSFTIANGGIYLKVASDASGNNWSKWYIAGNDTYAGGWLRVVVDLNKTPSETAGTPATLTSVRWFGFGLNQTGNSVAENLYIDRMDYGDGLQIEDGDSTTPGSWAELFADDDSINNKYGIIQQLDSGDYLLTGGVAIGDASSSQTTLWDDQSGAKVSFADPLYHNGAALVSSVDAANLYKITIVGNGTGTTDVDFGSVVGTGDDRQGVSGGTLGTAGPKWTLDAETDIADLDTVNFFGTSFEGAGLTQFSGSTKTDLIGCSWTACDEAQPNDAEFLNNSIIAPQPDRGLEMTSSQNIKQITFVAGGTDDRPANFVWQFDASGPTFTDFTTEFNDATANDVLPFPATEAVTDYIAFGSRQKFGKLRVNTGTAGAGGSPTVVWEYWSGSSWSTLGSISDGTTAFTTTGLQDVTYTQPTDWAATSLHDESPLFYVRARLTAVYSSTNPLITQGFIADAVEHHLHAPAAITENVDKCRFFGFGAAGAPKWMGENSSAGAVAWSVVNTGDLVTAEVEDTGGGSHTVANQVVVKVTVKDTDQVALVGARVYVQDNAGPFNDSEQIVREETNGSGEAQENHTYSGDLTVRVRVRLRGYLAYDQVQTIINTGLDLSVQLASDTIVE